MDRGSLGRNLRIIGLLGGGWSSEIEGLLGIFWKCRGRLYGSYRLIGGGIGRRIKQGLGVSLHHNQAVIKLTGFSRSCTATYPDLLFWTDLERDTSQNRLKLIISIPRSTAL